MVPMASPIRSDRLQPPPSSESLLPLSSESLSLPANATPPASRNRPSTNRISADKPPALQWPTGKGVVAAASRVVDAAADRSDFVATVQERLSRLGEQVAGRALALPRDKVATHLCRGVGQHDHERYHGSGVAVARVDERAAFRVRV